MAASCCTLAPVKQDYTPVGSVVTIGDMNVYIVGDKGANNAIILHYDIFGDHPNTRQVADILSRHGFRVAMPDLCRGDPWDAAKWPPPSMEVVFGHIGSVAPFDKVEKDILATADFLKSEGSAHIGIMGFCWGGRNSALLTKHSIFEAAVIIHPGGFSAADAAAAQSPVAIIAAQDDSDAVFAPLHKVFEGKFGAERAIYVRFDDVHHGFCASRSDFSNELMAKRANEALKVTHDFFKANLGAARL